MRPHKRNAEFSTCVRVMVAALMVWAVAVSSSAGASPTLVRSLQFEPGGAPVGSVPLGAVPAREAMQLSIVLPPSHADELQSLLGDLYDPTSSLYHQWLLPGQFASRFAPAAPDVSAVRSWLQSEGIATSGVSGFALRVSAPERTVSAALSTSFERYRAQSGNVGYLARQAPLLPQSLAGGQIAGIIGLDTLTRFQPVSNPTQEVTHLAGTGDLQRNADGLTPCPGAVSEGSVGNYTLDSLGSDYGIGSLLANGQNGHGETIGLFELASHSSSDVSTYLSCFGLSNPVSTVQVDGGGGPVGSDPTGEADLDIEQVATQSPGASIISYEGPNGTAGGAFDTWSAIVSADTAQVVSTSFGECEPFAHSAGLIPSLTTVFEQAAAQGQTVLASSGDSGAEDCYTKNLDPSEQVDYPASDAWVTAVGGTTRTAGSEVAWNFCQDSESTECADSNEGVAAGGGGMSRYEPRPAYQPDDLGWPTAQACGQKCRQVPDLSANAGTAMVFFTGGSWDIGWGTSFAAPLVAGMVADRDDGCTALTGVFTPALYALYDEGTYGSAFSDITSGDNDMTGTNGGAFAATNGYDPATGIGVPLAAGLSCPEVTSVAAGAAGQQVSISGLGLEHAAITFGTTAAQVISTTATQATVVVPSGSGTVTVSASSVLGRGTTTSAFSYGPSSDSPHGYWLVGSDGGIFSFGSAQFFGSTGSLALQRPVVGITQTADRGGYWLVASDGGLFSFGDSGFYSSVPALGIAPAGTRAPKSLDAPIVGLVPTADGHGYFMVGSDGGVFAFGDAKFEGSCPAIGGCYGAAVAVMPDASGNGYWVVTAAGAVYPFGDAANYGQPGVSGSQVVSAVRTPDGQGYWILFANGVVDHFGDAPSLGDAAGAVGGSDPAEAIAATDDGGGIWITTANGTVHSYGDAPNDGGASGLHLRGSIIAASGW